MSNCKYYMSMEQQMSGYEDTRVNSANQMQMQLADRHGEDILKFIETHAEEFRTLVEAHPEFDCCSSLRWGC